MYRPWWFPECRSLLIVNSNLLSQRQCACVCVRDTCARCVFCVTLTIRGRGSGSEGTPEVSAAPPLCTGSDVRLPPVCNSHRPARRRRGPRTANETPLPFGQTETDTTFRRGCRHDAERCFTCSCWLLYQLPAALCRQGNDATLYRTFLIGLSDADVDHLWEVTGCLVFLQAPKEPNRT